MNKENYGREDLNNDGGTEPHSDLPEREQAPGRCLIGETDTRFCKAYDSQRNV